MKSKFVNTRMNEYKTASQAVLQGIGSNGGLFVPESIPKLTTEPWKDNRLTYQDYAYIVLSQFFTEFTETNLKNAIAKAYSKDKFISIAPLTNFGNLSFLELFHGPTLSFKDMALSILPHLVYESETVNNDNTHKIILTATSGDTGKAALEAFKDMDKTTVIVFYPTDGVSPLQKQTMTTQEGKNVHVFGVDGNFDDAQRGVKEILNNEDLKKILSEKNMAFSSANSINIGRMLPQIVYYFWAYAQTIANGVDEGTPINFIVPTGNFGNILAGFFAKNMGLPIDTLICATNSNNVMYDYFKTGSFNPQRKFFTTISPAMDINIPSNFERLVHFFRGNEETSKLFEQLKENGKFDLKLGNETSFVSYWATEKETKEAMSKVYEKYNYVIDPHTAVAFHAYEQHNANTPTVIVSTASPYKFTKTVMDTIKPSETKLDDFEQIQAMATLKKEKAPKAIGELQEKPKLHTKTIKVSDMKQTVEDLLSVV